ncbi:MULTISPECIES: recombination protein NinG [Pseudomonas]|uniref:Transposase n=1 Tax=Pseudomonas savastanoi pv. nerii TaxID=360921 RepID=A0AB73QBR1_PSESS|nr:hypothetical protein DXU85_28895 [Pseudomonas savastanoi]PAB24906.1 hypothetical protein CC205_27080 [Pseudomonas savastanoi pv. nerii]PHN49836.1 hypothetical protein AO277_02870 [Pseudomonas amygdali]TSC26477.1 hypothetical protein FOM00_28600 [Pseudomonas sp. ST1]UKL12122.1 recombination protein NinG [Pseudomonas savastanoi pv. savastanoi]
MLAIVPANRDTARNAIADLEPRDLKIFKQKLKSGADFIRDAQTGFNAVIRERYMNLPCICCEPYRHRLHAE